MIAWYWFAFMTAIFSGIVFILQKKALKYEHASEFSTETSVIVFLLSLVLLPFADLSTFSWKLAGWMYVVSVIGAAGFLLISKGIRHSKISTVVPLVNFGPMLTALVAFIFLRESLSGMQIGGILLLVAGAYALEVDHGAKDILSPFKKIFRSKYMLLFLLGLLLYAFSSTIERFVLISKIDPLLSVVLIHLFLSFNFIVYELYNRRGMGRLVTDVKKHKWLFLLMAILMLAHRTMAYYAIQLTAAVALVSAIKRMGSFIATFFGGRFFHEEGIWHKSIACLIMIGGAILIVVF